MKITRIESIPVRVPIKPELAIRGGRGLSHSVSPFLLVRIHTDDGLCGVGEASCTPRWSGEDQVTAAHFVDNYFASQLIGATVDDIRDLTKYFSGVVANNYFTKAAVEMALWDLAGKAQQSPVWKLFGPRARDLVPTKWSVSGVAPAKAAEIAAWAVGQGFKKMKVKVGIDPLTDIERVRAVRNAVGPDIKLGVDANGGWPTPAVAIATISRLCDESNIYFAEQPVPAGDPALLAEVRRNVPVPIIADESIYTLADAHMLARAEAADVFS
ncbi:MAG TPA: enolase C-terminal domain-like protein, partial [Lacipirellulaceae bacterium]|nr:enolase C-terminal domain-like protein [Lacipirellulaceae bacterium]